MRIVAIVGPLALIASAPSSAAARPSRRFLLGFGLAILGALLFSAKAIVVKLAYRYGVDAATLLGLRMVLAMPFFAAAAVWAARRAPAAARLGRSDWVRVGFLGFTGYYLASYLDFLGLQYITAALERLILFLYPTVVMLLTAYLLRKSITRIQVLALVVSYAGIGVVFAHDLLMIGAGADRTTIITGAALVFGSAVSYAIYLVSSGELVQRVGSIRLTAYATLVACVLCIAQYGVSHSLAALGGLPLEVWGLSIINATACTVVPVFATMMAVSRIGAPNVSLTGMLGPIATIFLGAVTLGEDVTAWQLTGAALVVAGVFLITRRR